MPESTPDIPSEAVHSTEGRTLLDEEMVQEIKDKNAYVSKIRRIAKEIDDILVREELTWGDWGTIVEMFSSRISVHVSKTRIKKV